MRALTASLALGVLSVAVTATAQVPGQPEGVALASEQLPGPIVLVAEPHSLHFRVPAPPLPAEGEGPLAATVTVNYLPAGSNDYWGEPCFAWPAAAQTAMNYAASIWATLVYSNVPIVINACWADLDPGILGYSGTAGFYRDFSGAPTPNTWYPVSLANALHGSDLNGSNPDMHIAYNRDFHDSGTLYYGTDGNPAYNQYDFVTIVLHEITHGLGFAGSMRVEGSLGSWGFYGQIPPPYYPVAYDRPAEDSGGTGLINTAVYPNPSTALANALRSNAVYFNGTYANAANGGQRVKLYAPGTWSQGSSFSHLDEIFNGTPHALMTYSIPWDEAIHSPGTITMGLLWDIGWPVLTHPLTVIEAGSGSGTVTSSPPGIACGSDCSESFNWGTVVTLTAAASEGSTFAGWSGAGCSGTGTCQVTMTEARAVTATFSLNQYALTVNKDGAGTGTVTSSPAGINCGATCSAPFAYGTVVTLTAAAEPGSSFYGWTGPGCAGVGTCRVIADAARSVTATFSTGLVPLRPLVDVAAGAQADGNGILEPGESAVLSPEWSNPTPSPIAAAGAVSGFTGPAGATYGTSDAASDYGSVAAGAQADPYAATGNAYRIEVSDPAIRPAQHWDTQITETLSTGEVKTWTLHVGDSFTDVPRDGFGYAYVETLLHSGITAGCGGTLYCPTASLSRWQMAVFLAKALTDNSVPSSGTVPGLGSYLCAAGGTSLFLDVPPADAGCAYIHYIAAQGITAGCGGGNYCPSATLTRWQMAVFIAKAIGPDPLPTSGTVPGLGDYTCGSGGLSVFADVPPTDAACTHIHYIASEGITVGCGGGNYCPSSPLTRSQMAVFLTKAFDLPLYGP